MITALHEEKKLVLFCDLHGHSRSHGIFVYGCTFDENPESTRLFPYLLSKINSNFSFEKSRFEVEATKSKTARVALFKKLEIPAVYTLEASFSDTINGMYCTPNLLKSLGKDICLTLIPYCEIRLNPDMGLTFPIDKNE